MNNTVTAPTPIHLFRTPPLRGGFVWSVYSLTPKRPFHWVGVYPFYVMGGCLAPLRVESL